MLWNKRKSQGEPGRERNDMVCAGSENSGDREGAEGEEK